MLGGQRAPFPHRPRGPLGTRHRALGRHRRQSLGVLLVDFADSCQAVRAWLRSVLPHARDILDWVPGGGSLRVADA